MNKPNEEINQEEDSGLDSYKEKYQYALAEQQNQAKRYQKEKDELIKFSNEKLIKEIISQLDGFDEALKFITDAASRQGIEFIKGNLIKALEKFGLTKITAVPGEEFNPYIHEALDVINLDNQPDNTVYEQVQSGYQLNNKVLRAAKVTVVKLSLT